MMMVKELVILEQLEDMFLDIGYMVQDYKDPDQLKKLWMDNQNVQVTLLKMPKALQDILNNSIETLDWAMILETIKSKSYDE